MSAFVGKYLALIVIVAIVAVLVSKNAATAQVLQSIGSAMGNILGSIVQPITSGAQAANTKGN